jgi:hypothetical protein
VMVAAEHGVSFRLGEQDRRVVTPQNVQGIAPVPLFVKRPGQRRGRVSRAYARTADIAPTIAAFARIRLPWRTAGRSLFSRAVRRRGSVRIAGRSRATPVVKLSAGAFQARWRRSIRYQHAVFGFGGRGPGLFGIGPATALKGRRTTRLRLARRRGPRARLIGARELRNVRLRTRFRPSLVAGYISGGRRGARRTIAVAVNGRIAATGRSFYLRGDRRETFALLVPERAFVEGRNRLQVLAVSRRRGRVRYRLLAGV